MEAAEIKLLKKFLNGSCTKTELLQVQDLLQHPGADEVLDRLMIEQSTEEWNNTEPADATLRPTVDQWKNQLNDRISFSEPNDNKQVRADIPVRRLHIWQYAAIWAGLIIISGVGILQLKKTMQSPAIALVEKINTQGQPKRYLLPDSTEIFLGAGSKISYTATFEGKTRELTLKGQAFFQVKHDESKPFIIHTGEIQTQVLGTSFKIDAFEGQPLVVSVATGKVGVSRHNNAKTDRLALLTPGLKVTWNNHTGMAEQGTVDIYSLQQWKTGALVFDEQPLGLVFREIQERYHTKITIMDTALASYKVSGTFNIGEQEENVLKVLSVSGKFRYERSGKQTINIYRNEGGTLE
jgi:ferric-dicitrate binding protein FerR (iron transport regulator)